jgi:hypothetical protein
VLAYDTSVISAVEAQQLARSWALDCLPASKGEVGLYEFESGYVVWPVPAQCVDEARAVVDKATGELTRWPSLPVPAVAQRYQRAREARARFPGEVRDVLYDAGWRPGRDVSASVDRWLREVYAEHPAAREVLPMFPAARTALAEFGGLRFTQQRRLGYAGGGFRIETWPDAGRMVVDLYVGYATEIGGPVFPFAWYEDGPSDVVVDARGRVYLLHPAGDFLLAGTVDAAITALIWGPELHETNEYGRLAVHLGFSSVS